MSDDDLERRLRRMTVDHAELRWRVLRVDDDVYEIRITQQAHTKLLDEHSAKLQRHTELLEAHTARFDSLDDQLRTLTEMVQECLDRLPEPEQNGD